MTGARRCAAMGRTAPKHLELMDMVEHVAFDIGQLRQQFDSLKPGVARTGADNAALYSFLLHARNLLGFYWPPPKKDQRKGDVYAFDYVSGFVLAQPPITKSVDGVEQPVGIAELKRVISTKVAHICLDRRERVAWTTGVIYEVCNHGSEEFLVQVQEPYRSMFRQHKVNHHGW